MTGQLSLRPQPARSRRPRAGRAARVRPL